jgi:hypothetical protein
MKALRNGRVVAPCAMRSLVLNGLLGCQVVIAGRCFALFTKVPTKKRAKVEPVHLVRRLPELRT